MKEFHLQVLPFQVTDFLRQPQDLHLAGPLRKFAPGLVVLVIDRIPFAAQDILTFLHSSWLNDGLASLLGKPMRVEFIFDDGDLSTSVTPVPSFVEDFNREIDRCTPLPFHASARYLLDGLWKWKRLNARELCDRWDRFLGYASFPIDYSKDPTRDGVVIEPSTLPGGGETEYGDGQVCCHFSLFLSPREGHWCGVYHTFQGGCEDTGPYSSGDYVGDTPPQASAAKGCPTERESCVGGRLDAVCMCDSFVFFYFIDNCQMVDL